MEQQDTIQIVSYRGYATRNYIYCKGRVIENEHIESSEADGKWRNLQNNYRRFESDELVGVKLRITCNGEHFEVTTDEEGYYSLQTKLKKPIPKGIEWQAIMIEVTEVPVDIDLDIEFVEEEEETIIEISEIPTNPAPKTRKVKQSFLVQGELLIPSDTATFGVISDIDDTILETSVTSKIKMIYNTFFKNAFHRKGFEGVPELHKAFEEGCEGFENNPLFFISKSPWNLYDLLKDFLEIHQIPKAPILLRDFGIDLGYKADDYFVGSKYERCANILNVFPDLDFILIGDSGEKDTDIYIDLAKAFPNRIKVIYIRSVGDIKRDTRIQKLIEKTQEENLGIDILLIEHSLEIAKHAASKGFINEKYLNDFPFTQEEVEEDSKEK